MTGSYFVYIIAHRSVGGAEGPVKIGVTKSLGSRLASVQTGNWRKIVFANYFDMGTRELAMEAERLFHDHMAESRMCGEWFGISPSEALNVLCDIVWTLIEHHYPEDVAKGWLEKSGAVEGLQQLTQDWGTPH